MASGDTLFILSPQGGTPPATLYATLDTIADGSAPNTTIPVLDFDGAVNEHMDWHLTIPSHYAGTTGFTFQMNYAMDGTDGNEVNMEFRVLPLTDSLLLTGDLGIDTQTDAVINATPNGTQDDFEISGTIALAKASFGSAAAGTDIILRATRDEATTTNVNDLQLKSIVVTET